MNQKINDKKQLLTCAAHILTALYGLACLWLYYHQSVADLSAADIRFQSDLPLHISMIVEGGWYYSFTAYAYKLLYVLFGGSTLGIALLLALVSWATVYATEQFILTLGSILPATPFRQRGCGSLMLALTLNFVMPVYLPFVGEFRYVSYQSANIWHNSTYICMKLFALLTINMYFRLEPRYREGLSLRDWCVFALLNILTTGIKPSFLLAFSPIMGIFLLADLCRRVPLRKILLFGSALLPSGLVILWQNTVLFGSDTGNGITINPWYTFSLHANIPKLAAVCSLLFCGCVILCTLKELPGQRPYLFLVLMAALGFTEALCLVESGARSVDGNFLWGYSFCLSALFAVTAVKWLSIPKNSPAKRILRGCLTLIYGWHLYCGVYFFAELLTGTGYWM